MKRFLTTMLCLALCLGIFACGKENNNEPEEDSYVPTVFALKGPTGMGMVKLFDDKNYNMKLASSPDEVAGEIIAGRFDIAAVPSNLAATLYNKTEGKVKVLALNTMGVLFILENGDTVHSVKDLEGKTIGATGQGSTPEYILNYILAANGLENGKNVSVTYYTEHTELVTQMVSGKVDIGMLPEPNVSAAMAKKSELRIALDLTEEWNKISPDTGLTQGAVIVSKEFAEKHPSVLKKFTEDCAASVKFVLESGEEASKLIAEKGIVPSADIAKSALPNCSICFKTGDEMKKILGGTLKVLFDANPKSVGRKMPGEDFYIL